MSSTMMATSPESCRSYAKIKFSNQCTHTHTHTHTHRTHARRQKPHKLNMTIGNKLKAYMMSREARKVKSQQLGEKGGECLVSEGKGAQGHECLSDHTR
jgi:hypothetical protein